MNYYDVNQLKKIFFEYFVNKCDHKKISGYSLVPKVDNSVLYTPAGMHPLLPYLTGKYKHPSGNKLANIQKVVRTGAINKVGVDSFLTFFELFGVWIIGDYSKYDTLLKVWNFFTSKEYLNIPSDRLYITYFDGNELLGKDISTFNTWKLIGVSEKNLCPTKKNWKGPYSADHICGPNTRIYYDTLKDKCSLNCNVLCNCGKYVELWDVVFLDYILKENKLVNSPCKSVDMGAGVERIGMLVQNVKTIYETDILDKVVKEIKSFENISFIKDKIELEKKRRILADHFRCISFILGDENTIIPSSKGRGYVLRKIIRRAINNADELGVTFELYKNIVDKIIDLYSDEYPILIDKREFIINQITSEYNLYKLNLAKNILQVEKYLKDKNIICIDEITNLFDRYGVPIEVIKDITYKNKILIKE